MFYDDDVERPATGRRREEEGGSASYVSPSPRPSTASIRANHARQLEARRKERSNIGMVVASENMPRPSTAVGSRPTTASSNSSSNLLSSSTDSVASPSSISSSVANNSINSNNPNPTTSVSQPHSISATQSNSSSNLFSSSPNGSPRTTASTPRNDYPRPPTAMLADDPKAITDSEKELLKRGISPSFDPNVDKPLRPALDLTDAKTFTLRPPPKGGMIQCRIVREKKTGLLHPHYYLFLEENSSFLLAARKRKKSKSANYLISLDKQDMARDGPNYMGKLRSNFVGTEFVIYDKGLSAKELKAQPDNVTSEVRQELASVCYGSNVLGMKGPRKMTVLIPALRDNATRVPWKPSSGSDTLISRFQQQDLSNMVVLHNKSPVWNEETRSYVLNFHNRVKQASVKNFQLVHPDDPEYIILQFGRVSDDVFTMDFQYPMCMLQAFAIALSSFDNKLACE